MPSIVHILRMVNNKEKWFLKGTRNNFNLDGWMNKKKKLKKKKMIIKIKKIIVFF